MGDASSEASVFEVVKENVVDILEDVDERHHHGDFAEGVGRQLARPG